MMQLMQQAFSGPHMPEIERMSYVEPVWQRTLRVLAETLSPRGVDAWFVGGSVRDALLGRSLRDVDLAVAADEHALDELVSALPPELRGGVGRLRHDTVRVSVDEDGGLHLDISQLHGGSIEEDLANRDFTINAMAAPLAAWQAILAGEQRILISNLIDPLGGLVDLRAAQLRLTSLSAFEVDPGRILRAARFIAGLGMTPTTETQAAAREIAPEIEQLHPGRVHEELNALFALPQLAHGARWLRQVGALEHLAMLPPAVERIATPASELDALEQALALAAQVHPEAPSHSGILAPLATPLAERGWYAQPLWSGYSRFLMLPWSEFALTLLAPPQTSLAASGRPATRWFPWIMPVPGGQIERCAWAAARPLIPATQLLQHASPPLSELRHFFAMEPAMENYAVDALVVAVVRLVAEGEVSGGPADEAEEMVRRAAKALGDYFADERLFVPERLLTGRELNQLLPPSQYPLIGRLLRAVREAQLDGRITSREEAVAMARELAEQTDDTRNDT